jgi:hypothetical protein
MRRGFGLHSSLGAPAWLLVCLAIGCAAREKAAQSAAKPVRENAAKPVIASARDRLAQALRSIPRPLPVLDALPDDARKRLETRLAGLDAERKLAVHNDESPLVESLPLLHLSSGGTSPRALFALATTSAGTAELSGLLGVEHAASGVAPSAARIALAGELAQRAALDFLRDRAADVLVKGKSGALVCRLVARASESVGRHDLTLLAHELLSELEPNPIWREREIQNGRLRCSPKPRKTNNLPIPGRSRRSSKPSRTRAS